MYVCNLFFFKFQGEEEYGTTFDFVTIQLYEGYSHAEYNITRTGSVSPEEYLHRFVHAVTSGWQVDFSKGQCPILCMLYVCIYVCMYVLSSWSASSRNHVILNYSLKNINHISSIF